SDRPAIRAYARALRPPLPHLGERSPAGLLNLRSAPCRSFVHTSRGAISSPIRGHLARRKRTQFAGNGVITVLRAPLRRSLGPIPFIYVVVCFRRRAGRAYSSSMRPLGFRYFRPRDFRPPARPAAAIS